MNELLCRRQHVVQIPCMVTTSIFSFKASKTVSRSQCCLSFPYWRGFRYIKIRHCMLSPWKYFFGIPPTFSLSWNLRFDLSYFPLGVIPPSFWGVFCSRDTPHNKSIVISSFTHILLCWYCPSSLRYAHNFDSFIREILIRSRKQFLLWRLKISSKTFVLVSLTYCTSISSVSIEPPLFY